MPEKKKVAGHLQIVNDLPPGTEVFSDALIANVIYNLMDNATRYGGKVTTIHFSVQQSGDNYILLCEDDGEGVPVEKKDLIFDPGSGNSTGLGLAISREILDFTGISIHETGIPGKGARFEITVPKDAFRITPEQ